MTLPPSLFFCQILNMNLELSGASRVYPTKNDGREPE
jgi:hypothetical protein